MARPQEFDSEDVLDKAMLVFWHKGFDDTSIQDLVDATGLNRGSLYNAFGDKAQLFAQVMDRYRAASPTQILRTMPDDASPRQTLLQFFDILLERALNDPDHKGCLLTNTAAGLYGCSDAMCGWMEETLQGFEDALKVVIEKGQAKGEISSASTAQALARFMVSIAQGLNVMARANPRPQVLHDIVAQIPRILDH